jgi:undecaprenyl-diphosphatase
MLAYQLFISHIASTIVMIAVTGFLCLWLYAKKYRKEFDVIFFSTAVSLFVTHSLKYWLQVPRPVTALVVERDSRFPSGHATMAAVVMALSVYYASMYIRNTCLRWICYILAVWFFFSVSYSRLYLGVHVLVDVIAGGLIGVFSVLFVAMSFKHLRYYK